MAVEGELLETYYPGLTALSPKQCVVQMAMISASAVEIALVEVASSADVDTVKGIFQSRIDYQVGDGENPGGVLLSRLCGAVAEQLPHRLQRQLRDAGGL